MHAAKLRVELSQSKREQQQYLRNVELARVLDKRADRKRAKGEDPTLAAAPPKPAKRERSEEEGKREKKRKKMVEDREDEGQRRQLDNVLGSIF